VEFLVEIDVQWPADGDAERRTQLVAAEAQRAAELAEAGIIKRLWRRPGRWANFGLWEAADAGELHQAIASLPFFPWLKVTVHPLAVHPSDPAKVADGQGATRRR
jgi:muconolactone D-isomerase